MTDAHLLRHCRRVLSSGTTLSHEVAFDLLELAERLAVGRIDFPDNGESDPGDGEPRR